MPQASHCTSSVFFGAVVRPVGALSRAGRCVLCLELLGDRDDELVGVLRSRVLVALMRVPCCDVVVVGGDINAFCASNVPGSMSRLNFESKGSVGLSFARSYKMDRAASV